jgi:hypothetical protein
MGASYISSIIIGWFAASNKEPYCLVYRQIASLLRVKTTKNQWQI